LGHWPNGCVPYPRGQPKPRSKHFLTTEDVADIMHRYEAGETTQQVGNRYGISKTRVATILREQGVAIRRQRLTAGDVMEAATLYAAGKSLAWLGAHYGVRLPHNRRHRTPAPVNAAADARTGWDLTPAPETGNADVRLPNALHLSATPCQSLNHSGSHHNRGRRRRLR
jgi:hypothetical protein